MKFIKEHSNELGFGTLFLYLELVLTNEFYQNIYGYGAILIPVLILVFINFWGIKDFVFHTEWVVTSPPDRVKTICDTVELKINQKTMSVKGTGKLDSGKIYSITGRLSGQSMRLSFNGTENHEKEMAGCILLDLTADFDNLKGSWSQKSSNSHHLTGTVKFCRDRNNLGKI